MVEHNSQFEGSKCYPMLSISRVGFCLFYITKRIIRRRLKTNILFSDNHEFVMAAWKSWPDTLWSSQSPPTYFSSKNFPWVGCPRKMFTTIWHKGKNLAGEGGFIRELTLWSWKYSLIRETDEKQRVNHRFRNVEKETTFNVDTSWSAKI